MDLDAVAEVMREAHASTIAPHYRDLSAGEIEQSAAGEVVTVADRARERFIGPLLRDLVDAPVVGEDAAADDPGLLDVWPNPAPSGWSIPSPKLLAEEAGCRAIRPDGRPYRVDEPGSGLIVANRTIAEPLRRLLFGPASAS